MIMMMTSLVRPTAVRMESNENIMSSRMIWMMIPVILTFFFPPAASRVSSSPSVWWLISRVLFAMRNMPPKIRIRSRPLMEASSLIQWGTSKRGSLNFITHVMVSRRSILTPMARTRPIFLVRARISMGRRLETIEIKMMLSMPRTTSKNVRVINANQVSGLRKISICRV